MPFCGGVDYAPHTCVNVARRCSCSFNGAELCCHMWCLVLPRTHARTRARVSQASSAKCPVAGCLEGGFVFAKGFTNQRLSAIMGVKEGHATSDAFSSSRIFYDSVFQILPAEGFSARRHYEVCGVCVLLDLLAAARLLAHTLTQNA